MIDLLVLNAEQRKNSDLWIECLTRISNYNEQVFWALNLGLIDGIDIQIRGNLDGVLVYGKFGLQMQVYEKFLHCFFKEMKPEQLKIPRVWAMAQFMRVFCCEMHEKIILHHPGSNVGFKEAGMI